MMRSVAIGQYNGKPIIRAARPGYDAVDGPLDGMLFDADAIPAKRVGGSEFEANYNTLQLNFAFPVPMDTAVPHGIPAGVNFVIFAVGIPTMSRTGYEGLWWYFGKGLNGVPIQTISSATLNNGAMDHNFSTPWRIEGDFGNGRTYWGGWSVRWDETNIIVSNTTDAKIYVRWIALEQ